MSKPMSQATIEIVKSTASVMQTHGVAITTRMYERLFRDPEMEALFERSWDQPGGQPKRLAAAILAFAQNADKLENLALSIERISARHVKFEIRPEHYPAVADALLPAIRDVLGEAIDDKTIDAWGEAYWYLADVLTARESALYIRSTGSNMNTIG